MWELEGATQTIAVDVFAGVDRPHLPNREELRTLCDAYKTKEKNHKAPHQGNQDKKLILQR